MEAILNFIKEALAGKKMSAQWIVTIVVAVSGLIWAGMVVYQEYLNMLDDVAEVKTLAHEKTPEYDDAPLSARVTANSDAIIKLQQRPRLDEDVKNNSQVIVGMKEQINALDSKISNLMRDIEKAEDKIDNRNSNPLAM